MTTWDPLRYCSSEELCRLDERFNYALHDVTCLVFWTGVPPELAQTWAKQHRLPTLTIVMGPLFSDRDIGSARYGKSANAWSKYMKAASGRFAEFACRGNRHTVVLTKPPPNIYSSRVRSNYRDLEEPILKGVFGGPGTAQIEYVHPTIKDAATFQYQVWPLDRSSTWSIFFKNILSRGSATFDVNDTSVKVEVLPLANRKSTIAVQMKQEKEAQKSRVEAQEMQKQTKSGQQKALGKKEANRKAVEQEQRKAQELKAAKRKKAKMEKRMAQEKKAEMEQRMAREKKAANRRKAEMEQQKTREKKEMNRRKAEMEQQKAREKKEAKRKQVELKRQRAQDKKQSKLLRKAEEAARKMEV